MQLQHTLREPPSTHLPTNLPPTQAAKGDRFSVLAASTIKRYYHSTALLLPSGDVLVMGSEQSDCLPACTEFNPPVSVYIPSFTTERKRTWA